LLGLSQLLEITCDGAGGEGSLDGPKIKLIMLCPMTTGRNFDEILRVIDFPATDRQAQGRHAGELEARRAGSRVRTS
jgi:hypothetical protein